MDRTFKAINTAHKYIYIVSVDTVSSQRQKTENSFPVGVLRHKS